MRGLVAAAALIAAGDDGDDCSDKKRKSDSSSCEPPPAAKKRAASSSSSSAYSSKGKTKDISAARTRRLEQNRRAAIESRRRKKLMIGELQRSVAFYTKANENLSMDNRDLEQRLFLAKQQVMQMGTMGTVAPAAALATLKSPPEDFKKPMAESKQNKLTNAPPTQPLHPSASPAQQKPDQAKAQAQLTATQAMYETMGFPSGAARVAASTFSQFVGLTGNMPSTPPTDAAVLKNTTINAADINNNSEAKPSAPEAIVAQLPSEEQVGSDKYIEMLKKCVFFSRHFQFAMQQTAAANAAAAAANAAMQALAWHKMTKASGSQNPQPPLPYAAAAAAAAAPISMPSAATTSTTSAPAKQPTSNAFAPTKQPAAAEEDEPPTEKPKS
ncbi:hypothetical protein ACHAXR_011049 [Thalassiosira sp. AJA248-18]